MNASWRSLVLYVSKHDSKVINERVGDNDFVFIKGCKASKAGARLPKRRCASAVVPLQRGFLREACSILLRGANEFMLEEASRSAWLLVAPGSWKPCQKSGLSEV